MVSIILLYKQNCAGHCFSTNQKLHANGQYIVLGAPPHQTSRPKPSLFQTNSSILSQLHFSIFISKSERQHLMIIPDQIHYFSRTNPLFFQTKSSIFPFFNYFSIKVFQYFSRPNPFFSRPNPLFFQYSIFCH